MRRSAAGRARPDVPAGVLRIGGLAAAAAAALAAVLAFSAGPAPARGGGPRPPLADGGGCPPPPPDLPRPRGSCSPVIIDVDGSGYQLTDAVHGVTFDFFGTGHPVRIAWTAAGSTNAFLVLPRGGRVTDGRELFGNLTPQPASAHPNGFAALAVWDQPGHGGDGDGLISAADAIWPRLRLWQDADHDGKAQPGELRPLAAFGITGISLQPRWRARPWPPGAGLCLAGAVGQRLGGDPGGRHDLQRRPQRAADLGRRRGHGTAGRSLSRWTCKEQPVLCSPSGALTPIAAWADDWSGSSRSFWSQSSSALART